eukprot:TRINITY_DN640_c0_g1_i1.p1 TRINITY_DN640_c0_g1~~TRINITY_DN640_c0_g1_i1.p1  ORF type:complete len:2443 (+),score=476.06 TRINITY_DN640_c0_g1_i1:24-7352(+)
MKSSTSSIPQNVGTKTKFASSNINSIFKPTVPPRPPPAYGRMVVLGKSRGGKGITKQSNVKTAPLPLNLPSMKSESLGSDSNIAPFVSGSGWGQKSNSGKDEYGSEEDDNPPGAIAITKAEEKIVSSPVQSAWNKQKVEREKNEAFSKSSNQTTNLFQSDEFPTLSKSKELTASVEVPRPVNPSPQPRPIWSEETSKLERSHRGNFRSSYDSHHTPPPQTGSRTYDQRVPTTTDPRYQNPNHAGYSQFSNGYEDQRTPYYTSSQDGQRTYPTPTRIQTRGSQIDSVPQTTSISSATTTSSFSQSSLVEKSPATGKISWASENLDEEMDFESPVFEDVVNEEEERRAKLEEEEREREREREREEREREGERQRQKQVELERQRELQEREERERIEREKEVERQKEIELEREKEKEREREAEKERHEKEEKERDLKRLEADRERERREKESKTPREREHYNNNNTRDNNRDRDNNRNRDREWDPSKRRNERPGSRDHYRDREEHDGRTLDNKSGAGSDSTSPSHYFSRKPERERDPNRPLDRTEQHWRRESYIPPVPASAPSNQQRDHDRPRTDGGTPVQTHPTPTRIKQSPYQRARQEEAQGQGNPSEVGGTPNTPQTSSGRGTPSSSYQRRTDGQAQRFDRQSQVSSSSSKTSRHQERSSRARGSSHGSGAAQPTLESTGTVSVEDSKESTEVSTTITSSEVQGPPSTEGATSPHQSPAPPLETSSVSSSPRPETGPRSAGPSRIPNSKNTPTESRTSYRQREQREQREQRDYRDQRDNHEYQRDYREQKEPREQRDYRAQRDNWTGGSPRGSPFPKRTYGESTKTPHSPSITTTTAAPTPSPRALATSADTEKEKKDVRDPESPKTGESLVQGDTGKTEEPRDKPEIRPSPSPRSSTRGGSYERPDSFRGRGTRPIQRGVLSGENRKDTPYPSPSTAPRTDRFDRGERTDRQARPQVNTTGPGRLGSNQNQFERPNQTNRPKRPFSKQSPKHSPSTTTEIPNRTPSQATTSTPILLPVSDVLETKTSQTTSTVPSDIGPIVVAETQNEGLVVPANAVAEPTKASITEVSSEKEATVSLAEKPSPPKETIGASQNLTGGSQRERKNPRERSEKDREARSFDRPRGLSGNSKRGGAHQHLPRDQQQPYQRREGTGPDRRDTREHKPREPREYREPREGFIRRTPGRQQQEGVAKTTSATEGSDTKSSVTNNINSINSINNAPATPPTKTSETGVQGMQHKGYKRIGNYGTVVPQNQQQTTQSRTYRERGRGRAVPTQLYVPKRVPSQQQPQAQPSTETTLTPAGAAPIETSTPFHVPDATSFSTSKNVNEATPREEVVSQPQQATSVASTQKDEDPVAPKGKEESVPSEQKKTKKASSATEHKEKTEQHKKKKEKRDQFTDKDLLQINSNVVLISERQAGIDQSSDTGEFIEISRKRKDKKTLAEEPKKPKDTPTPTLTPTTLHSKQDKERSFPSHKQSDRLTPQSHPHNKAQGQVQSQSQPQGSSTVSPGAQERKTRVPYDKSSSVGTGVTTGGPIPSRDQRTYERRERKETPKYRSDQSRSERTDRRQLNSSKKGLPPTPQAQPQSQAPTAGTVSVGAGPSVTASTSTGAISPTGPPPSVWKRPEVAPPITPLHKIQEEQLNEVVEAKHEQIVNDSVGKAQPLQQPQAPKPPKGPKPPKDPRDQSNTLSSFIPQSTVSSIPVSLPATITSTSSTTEDSSSVTSQESTQTQIPAQVQTQGQTSIPKPKSAKRAAPTNGSSIKSPHDGKRRASDRPQRQGQSQGQPSSGQTYTFREVPNAHSPSSGIITKEAQNDQRGSGVSAGGHLKEKRKGKKSSTEGSTQSSPPQQTSTTTQSTSSTPTNPTTTNTSLNAEQSPVTSSPRRDEVSGTGREPKTSNSQSTRVTFGTTTKESPQEPPSHQHKPLSAIDLSYNQSQGQPPAFVPKSQGQTQAVEAQTPTPVLVKKETTNVFSFPPLVSGGQSQSQPSNQGLVSPNGGNGTNPNIHPRGPRYQQQQPQQFPQQQQRYYESASSQQQSSASQRNRGMVGHQWQTAPQPGLENYYQTIQPYSPMYPGHQILIPSYHHAVPHHSQLQMYPTPQPPAYPQRNLSVNKPPGSPAYPTHMSGPGGPTKRLGHGSGPLSKPYGSHEDLAIDDPNLSPNNNNTPPSSYNQNFMYWGPYPPQHQHIPYQNPYSPHDNLGLGHAQQIIPQGNPDPYSQQQHQHQQHQHQQQQHQQQGQRKRGSKTHPNPIARPSNPSGSVGGLPVGSPLGSYPVAQVQPYSPDYNISPQHSNNHSPNPHGHGGHGVHSNSHSPQQRSPAFQYGAGYSSSQSPPVSEDFDDNGLPSKTHFSSPSTRGRNRNVTPSSYNSHQQHSNSRFEGGFNRFSGQISSSGGSNQQRNSEGDQQFSQVGPGSAPSSSHSSSSSGQHRKIFFAVLSVKRVHRQM